METTHYLRIGDIKLKVRPIPVISTPRTAGLNLKTTAPLRARFVGAQISSAEAPWMYCPGGDHTINCAAGEGAAEVTIRVDESSAVILNAKLAEINARNAPQRAFVDKEHDEASGAVTWPTRFVWRQAPEPGVYIEHEPSELGRQLVSGKIMRAFSPSFYSDADLPKRVTRGQFLRITAGKRGSPENPARITGLVFPACGTLTNNPAFRKILPLWAKACLTP